MVRSCTTQCVTPALSLGHWGLDTAGSQVLSTNQWYHLSYTFANGATQAIYVNGSLDATSVQDNLRHNSELLVGTSGNGGTVAGVLDDVMVFDQLLSLPQIQHLAAGGDPTNLPDPQFSGLFTDNIQTANGKWNRVSYYNVLTTYEQAQALAASKSFSLLDGRLATPRNQLDSERLVGMWEANSPNTALIGLDDVAVEGEWRLATGEHIWQGLADGSPVGWRVQSLEPG